MVEIKIKDIMIIYLMCSGVDWIIKSLINEFRKFNICLGNMISFSL